MIIAFIMNSIVSNNFKRHMFTDLHQYNLSFFIIS